VTGQLVRQRTGLVPDQLVVLHDALFLQRADDLGDEAGQLLLGYCRMLSTYHVVADERQVIQTNTREPCAMSIGNDLSCEFRKANVSV
jgi:hypothetical protein